MATVSRSFSHSPFIKIIIPPANYSLWPHSIETVWLVLMNLHFHYKMQKLLYSWFWYFCLGGSIKIKSNSNMLSNRTKYILWFDLSAEIIYFNYHFRFNLLFKPHHSMELRCITVECNTNYCTEKLLKNIKIIDFSKIHWKFSIFLSISFMSHFLFSPWRTDTLHCT